MEHFNFKEPKSPIIENVGTRSIAKSFLANVFLFMTGALTITGVISYLFGTEPALLQFLYNIQDGVLKPTMLAYIVMFAPIGLVLLMSFRFNKMSAIGLMSVFVIYSILMGMSLSTIFLVYSGASIFKTFLVTAGTFGIMAVLGYTTKTDLTKFGSILIMGVIGLIIASIVNMIWYSTTMDLIISLIGVLIFTGLTAYDVQKLKQIGEGVTYGSEPASKLAIMGALSLYLDFINLFLFLLRFLGNNRD
ncbi:MAG: Bax inhibitor-1/YccA family protein [Vicingaceae bacterium]